MSKITLKCKKYKRKCIDKALSVYLKEAGYIFNCPSVEEVFYKLGLAQLGFTRIHAAQQALYNIVAEDKILPYSPSSLGEIYCSVFFKCHEPCLAELMHHFRCGRFADIYLSREHAEANRAGLRTVAANHLKIVFLRRRESVFAPVFAAVESKKFFAAVHAHSPFSQMPILWYRETFFPRVNLY